VKRSLLFASSSLLGLAALSTVPACGDGGGAGGESILSRSEPASDRDCPNGGTTLLTGADRDGDGVLGDAEVAHAQTVCRGATVPTVVRIDAEPAGAHCPGGGKAVRSGADRNGDGVLEDAEVTATTYACERDAVYYGDFTAAQWHDPQAVARLGDAEVVIGNIAMGDSKALDPVSLPRLLIVHGSITIGDGAGAAIELPSLTEITGDLSAHTAAVHGRFALPSLVRVGGTVDVGLPGADEVEAPVLRQIGGSLLVSGSGIAEVAMPRLASIGGSLSVIDTALAELPLPALQTVGVNVIIGDNRALTSVAGLAALATVSHTLSIVDNAALATVELPALQFVGDGSFNANATIGGDAVVAVRLPALFQVRGRLRLHGRALASLKAPQLWNAGSVELTSTPALAEVDLATLERIGAAGLDGDRTVSVLIQGTGLTHVPLPSLATADGELAFRDDPALVDVTLPVLSRAGSVVVARDAALTSIALSGLGGELSDLVIQKAPVTSLALGQLTAITARFELNDTQLTTFDGARLDSVGGLVLIGNARLADLRALTGVRRLDAIFATRNGALTSLTGLEGIDSIGDVSLWGNPALTSLAGLDRVTAIRGRLEIAVEDALTTLDNLAALRTIGGNLTISGNHALTSIAGLDNLTAVGGQVAVSDVPSVPAQQVSALVARWTH
jgi:hypothetical protein